MLLFVLNHPYHYELENLCRVFYPQGNIQVRKAGCQPSGRMRVIQSIEIITQIKNSRLLARVHTGKKSCSLTRPCGQDDELALAQMLFALLRRETGYLPPWGLLTGVRPAKLMLRLRHDKGSAQAVRYFRDTLWVSEAKTALAQAVAETEEPILAQSGPRTFSLYVSIPFCPSRCSYCSFVSHTVDRSSAQKLIPEYLERLCAEFARTGEIAAQLGLRLASVYIGGGTPTTLSAGQLAQLCNALHQNFAMQHCGEFTVEAGRPDTITREKLLTLKDYAVNRLSINPQSMQNAVLQNVGRPHTAEDVVDCYHTARSLGFTNVNMDLIAGLPGDDPKGFQSSLEQLFNLKPENITVHTLALKRSSALHEIHGAEDCANMLAIAGRLLPAAGYAPYYMYRQSRSLGNLENIGWSLPGHLCRYNIDMMEESHTILACGAGGVTKLKQWGANSLERVFSLKYPYEYLARFEELLARKERIFAFYETYNRV